MVLSILYIIMYYLYLKIISFNIYVSYNYFYLIYLNFI